jgi:D-methionine transport system substrate-binding protein
VQPNLAVSDKQLDANFFQNRPYLDSFNKDRKTDIVEVPGSDVHIEPLRCVLAEDQEGVGAARRAPSSRYRDDPSNSGRALALLATRGAHQAQGRDQHQVHRARHRRRTRRSW